ncbi:MAG: leucine-rich repeat domain-containing protein, partial [Clostridia bacterium]|nr:leucine-rich repeat domain-containing protein [Clostridia bacterium]
MKKVLSIFLAVLLIALSVPLAASAASSGNCGQRVTWNLYNNGTLVISGTGQMYNWNWNYGTAPWHNSASDIKKVVINDGVTSIGDFAFEQCRNLTDITIPDSVTSIGQHVFGSCQSLTSITIPDSVTSLGEFTFQFCASLQSVTIPSSVASIGKGAFEGCFQLQNIEVVSNNDYFCDVDGVLFNKNKTELISFPY